MASAVIGALRVTLGVDSAQFTSGIKDAQSTLDRFANVAVSNTVRKLATLAAAIAAPTAIIALTKASLDTIDAQSKLATQLDSSIEGIQALEYAADLAGISSDELTGIMGKLNQTLGQVTRTGAGPAADALRRIGLSVTDLTNMDADQKLAKIAEAIQQQGLSAAETADLLRQLGIRQADVFALMADGGQALRDARKDVEDFGIALTNINGQSVEAANDAISKIGYVLTGIGNQIAVSVAPYIEALADDFTNAAREGHGFGEAVGDAIGWVIAAVGKVADGVFFFRIGLLELEKVGVGVFDALAGRANDFGNTVLALIPGLGGTTGALARVVGQADGVSAAFADIESQLDALKSSPLPSAGLADWVDQAHQLAAEMEHATGLQDRFTAMFGDTQAAPGMQAFLDSLKTAEEQENDAYQARLDNFHTFEAQMAARGIDTNAVLEGIEQAHQDKLRQIRDGQQNHDLEQMKSKFDAVVASLADESQAAQNQYQQRLADLNAYLAATDASEQESAKYRKALATQLQTELTAIDKKASDKRRDDQLDALSAIGDMFGSLSQIVGTEGEKQLKISKALSIAQAVINTAEGITKALAGPFPFIHAAAIAAAGAAQIAAIRRTTSSSASNPPSVGSAPDTSAAAAGASANDNGGGQAISIHLSGGPMFSTQQLRDLIDALNKTMKTSGTTLQVA